MATIQFMLRSKASKKVPIFVRFVNGRKTDLERSTGFLIDSKDWNTPKKEDPVKKTDNLPKQNNAENKLIFKNLKKLESFIFDNLNKDLGAGKPIGKLWLETQIKECFNRIEKNDTELITNYLQDIIDNASTRKVKVKGGYRHGISLSRKNSFIATKTVITEYEKKIRKQTHFIDVNQDFIDKFEIWLLITKKYAVNTSSKHIANIKTICIEAEIKGKQVNPYAKNIIVVSESDDDRHIQTLSFQELETIRTAEITQESYKNARKWLLIGCEIGQRGGDLINITKDNIRYKGNSMYLDIKQQKTKKSVTIGIIAPHVINIIKNEFPYKISTQKLNDYIKKVCEIAKINTPTKGKIFDAKTGRKELNFYEKHKLITTHCFRRSFCTNYYKKIPTPVLMGISGHSKESIFRIYINADEDTDDNADLFMKLYESISKDIETKSNDKPSLMNVV